MEDRTIAIAEVVLRDFDGTKTIYPTKMPLSEMISNGDTDEGILVIRRDSSPERHCTLNRSVRECREAMGAVMVQPRYYCQ